MTRIARSIGTHLVWPSGRSAAPPVRSSNPQQQEAGRPPRGGTIDRGPRRAPGDRGGRHARAEVLRRRQVGGHRRRQRGLRHRVGAGAQGRPARPARHARNRGRHRGAQGRRGAGPGRREPRAPRVRARAAAQAVRPHHASRASTTPRAPCEAAAGGAARRRRRRSRRPRRGWPSRSSRSPMDGVVASAASASATASRTWAAARRCSASSTTALLDLTVSVPSTRLAAVRVGQPLEFTADAFPGRAFTGKVMFINPAIDAASRSAKVVAEVPNRDGALRAAPSSRAGSSSASAPGVLQVPREALLNWNLERQHGRRVRRRRRQGGEARRSRPAMPTGELGRDRRRASSRGEQVVTRGGFALRAGRPRRGRRRARGRSHVPLEPLHQAAGRSPP